MRNTNDAKLFALPLMIYATFADRDLLPKPGSIMPRPGATSPEGEELM